MSLRTFILAVALFLCVSSTTDAVAQTESPEQIAAARAMIYTLGFDEFGVGVSDLIAPDLPELRDRVTRLVDTDTLSKRGRTALATYVEGLPTFIRSELRTALDELVDAAASRSASLFTVDQWNGIAAFFRDPVARSFMAKMNRGERALLTPGEQAVARAFYATDAGAAYAAHAIELNRHLDDTRAQEMPSLISRMLDRMHGRLCEAIEDECPAALQALLPHD